MNNFFERYQLLCNELKVNIYNVPGNSPSTIDNWKKNGTIPTGKKLTELSQYFKVSIDYLLGQSDIKEVITYDMLEKNIPPKDKQLLEKYRCLSPNNKSIVDYILEMGEESAATEQNQLPDNIDRLIDMGKLISIDTYIEKVSAGNGNTMVTGHTVSKLYPATKASSKATYAAIIKGDSMEPRFIDNDIIYVDDNRIPKHNDIGVFTYNSETYCKKYYAIDGIEKLISLNDSYEPIIINNTLRFEKQGVVIGKFHAD